MSNYQETGRTWREWADLRAVIMARDRAAGGDGYDQTHILRFRAADKAEQVLVDLVRSLTGQRQIPVASALIGMMWPIVAELIDSIEGIVAVQWGGIGDLGRQGAAVLVAAGDAPVSYRIDPVTGHWLSGTVLTGVGNGLWREMLCHKLGCGPVDQVGQPGVLWPYREHEPRAARSG